MKISFVLLALVAAPSLAVAQTQTTPVRVAASQEPMPKAQELFDNLFAPYVAAKTFSGNFDIFLLGNNPTNTLSEIHLQTAYRFDNNGDLARQNATVGVVGRVNSKEKATFHFIHSGQNFVVALDEQKSWWTTEQGDTVPAFQKLLKPILDDVIQVLNGQKDFVPVVSKSVEAGRPVWILKAKGSNAVRIVVDAQTRALRSLDIKDNVSIRGYGQEFNEPIADESFTWTPPLDFKQVVEGAVSPPASLGFKIANSATEKVTPTN